MTHELNAEKFGTLPLDAQIDFLKGAVGRTDPLDLLSMCGGLRDHAPLSWLCRRLLRNRWFAEEPHRRWFARFLFGLPDTAVDKIIKSLVARVHGTQGSTAAQLSSLLADALGVAPLSRLPAMCLVDRALKHNFPEVRKRYLDALMARCLEHIERSEIDGITVHRLAQLSADDIALLRERAAAAGPELRAALDRTHERLAREAVEVLGDTPKGVSQSNAEELLARRVYTDPGHFLTELLQNAEDADAVTWRVLFDRDRIVVWHDGRPFDTKDLVGVTSIGQTTKRKDQIGFFGVGFKAIYEVTDRPQIYSDVYNFEIVDISVPKTLSSRPAGVPRDGTLLVMPLRDPDDPERSSKALYEKARALDPVVLFTLRDIDVIDLELTEAAGGPARHAVREGVSSDHRYSTIDQTPDNRRFAWAIQDDLYQYDRGLRMPGKPDATKVMVGVSLDGDRLPAPIDSDSATTVYSYLPTAERSGLSFFVQGHFDVPVDRERITQDSPWNRWILTKVPSQLARVFERLSDTEDADLRRRIAAAFLEILPLEEELSSPVFREITKHLPEAFDGLAVIPGTDGRCHPPATSVLMPPAMARLFEGEALIDGDGEARHAVDAALGERARAAVAALGCRRFDVADLIAHLEAALSETADGVRPAEAGIPWFLRHPEPEKMARLYRLLQQHMDHQENGKTKLAALRFVSRVARLPLLPDGDGGLHRARPAEGPPIARGTLWIRSILGDHRPFLEASLDPAAAVSESPEDAPSPGWLTAFYDRLKVKALELSHVILQLEEALSGISPPLSDLADTAFPGSEDRLNRIFAAMAEAPFGLQLRMARLPVFRSADGRRYPVAKNQDDTTGVLALPTRPDPEERPLVERLSEFYGARRPVTRYVSGAPEGVLLERINAPVLCMDTLLADLEREDGVLDRGLEGLRRLHALLEDLRDKIPSNGRRLLVRLPIWPDTHGRARPLKGEDAVYVPGDDAIRDLFENVPFIDPEVGSRRHLTDMKVDAVGASAVIDALAPEAKAPLRIDGDGGRLQAVWSYLTSKAESIGPRGRRRLAELPVFSSRRGDRRPLTALSVTDSPDLSAIYEGYPKRHFISDDPAQRQIIHALGLTPKLRKITRRVLIEDLRSDAETLARRSPGTEEVPFLTDEAQLRRLLVYLAGSAEEMPRAEARAVLQVPLYPDQTGALCTVRDLAGDGEPRDALAADGGFGAVLARMAVPVVRADIRDIIRPLLETAQLPAFDIAALVDHLTPLEPVRGGAAGAPVQSPPALDEIHDLLVMHQADLERACPPPGKTDETSRHPALAGLCIWPTVSGDVIPGTDAVDTPRLLELVPALGEEREAVAEVTLDPRCRERFERLIPLIMPRSEADFLAERVRLTATPGAPLAEQPGWLDSVEKVGRVVRAFLELSDADLVQPGCPLVDARGRLCHSALRRADPSTRALLAGTDAEKSLLHAELAAMLPEPRLEALDDADPTWVLERFDVVQEESEVSVEDHPLLEDPARRRHLYDWLVARERSVFTDRRARDLLARLPLFPSGNGRMLRPAALVIDEDLPDLGLDWAPHPEIPQQTLALLTRHLGVGRARIEDLLEAHLLPAYHRACDDRDGGRAGAILAYMARRLERRSADDIRALLLRERPLGVENARGEFVPVDRLVIPPPDIAELVETVFEDRWFEPHPDHLPRGIHGFLSKLGARGEPPLESLTRVLEGEPLPMDRALALCGLCGVTYQRLGEALLEAVPLTGAAWVPDAAGTARRPGELYLWEPEVAALIGEAESLYLHQRAAALLTEPLCRALKFRDKRDVSVEAVFAHIASNVSRCSMVPFQVYLWMERGLQEGWLDRDAVTRIAGDTPWILTDDGTYFSHRRVIGTRALQYFGDYRGYWERGRRQCPALFSALQIPPDLSAAGVTGFLTEIGDRVRADSDRRLLAEMSALPRMLLKCYRFLGEANAGVDPNLPVILCRGHGADSPEEGTLRLLPVGNPRLFKSDTPTLETLFQEIGDLYFVSPGTADDRVMIDRFYQRMGVRSLSRAFTLKIDPSKADRSADRPEAIARLLTRLRGLLAVLPRVKRQRTLMDADGWGASERLRRLVDRKRIQAIDGLTVTYCLEALGSVQTSVPAVYDPAAARLMVDTALLNAPHSHITGLAGALTPCIYDGPGADQLADILEILLGLETRRQMEAYLDRRHFPVVAEGGSTPLDLLFDRVDEILDYGLDRRLAGAHPELDAGNLETWRDRERLRSALGAGLEELDDEALARRVARALLETAEVADPGARLFETLRALLTADSLNDIPASLLGAETGPVPERAGAPRPMGGGFDTNGRDELPSDKLTEQLLSYIVKRAKEMPDEPPAAKPSAAGSSAAEPRVTLGELPTRRLDNGPVAPADDPPVEPPGFWARLTRWFGGPEAPDPVTISEPPWAARPAACFTPRNRIEPQLWANPAARQRVAGLAAPYRIAFSPGRLPAPYLYAPQVLGGRFYPESQSWTAIPASLSRKLARPVATGQTVLFQGVIPPGDSQLPVPLYGRLRGKVTASGDAQDRLSVIPAPYWTAPTVASLVGESPALIQYEVELLRPPPLTGTAAYADDIEAMVAPTVSLRDLPREVRRWLRQHRWAGSPWQRALEVQRFVREHYRYDGAFMDRPEVREALGRLVPGKGNHHLTLLHAAGDDRVLGRGICYELNTLVAELLRHLSVPSLVCTGWVLNQGALDRPDHLFAVAVLPSPRGLSLLPLEAAVGPDGPLRAVEPGKSHVMESGIRPPPRPAVAAIPGPWTAARTPAAGRGDRAPDAVTEEIARLAAEAAVLTRAIRLICKAGDRPVPLLEPPEGFTATPESMEKRVDDLQTKLEALLPDQNAVTTLLYLLRSGPTQLPALGPDILALIEKGLATARALSTYEVRPLDTF